MNRGKSHLEDLMWDLLVSIRDDNDPDSRLQLNNLLRNDPSARSTMARLLVDEQALINRLRQDGIVAMLEPKPQKIADRKAKPSPILRKVAGTSRRWLALGTAAAFVFAGYLGWRVMHPKPPIGNSQATQPVAVLKEDVDAVWKSIPPRGPLLPGTLHLTSGMAALEFTSGARVLIEGPAELELTSGMEAIFRSGNLRAHVPPPAQGFTIVTPSTRVVDRGTVFGLTVRQDGSTLVKVIQGEVELHHPEKIYQIKTNAAATVDPGGDPTPATTRDEVFPSEENFNLRIAAGARRSAARWQMTADELAKDPATLLCYNFTESLSSSRTVRNHAAGATLESHGTLVGVGWTEGRWPGKHALEFSGRSDSLLFKLQHSAPAATLLAWVRVDSLPNLYQILLMPEHQRASALQWMIDQKGQVRLALTSRVDGAGSPAGWDGPVKAPAISNADFGRWIFLASTYDSQTGKVIHYRDGTPIGSGYFKRKLPVVFGSFSCGNWSNQTKEVASGGTLSPSSGTRNFAGSIDELMVLSRALSATEILDLHEKGKP